MGVFVLACLVAFAIGAVTARLMRVAGLILVLGLLVLCGIAAVLAGLPHPTLVPSLVLLALAQAGYLAGAVVFWPVRGAHATPKTPPLSTPDDRSTG
jgi:hypothetical protein